MIVQRLAFVLGLVLLMPNAIACEAWTAGLGLTSLDAGEGPTRARVRIASSAFTTAAGIPPRFTLDGLSADPVRTETLALSVACTLSPHWSVQIDAGVPPVVEVRGDGLIRVPGAAGAALRIDLGDPQLNPVVRQRLWSPILLARYSFGAPTARLRPFLSAGLSYTWFTDESIGARFEAEIDRQFGQPLALANGRPGRTRTRLDLASAWAPVVGAGVGLRLSSRWTVSASAGWSPVEIEGRFRTRAADGSPLAAATSRTRAEATGLALMLTYGFDPD
jgi:outer membrane protein